MSAKIEKAKKLLAEVETAGEPQRWELAKLVHEILVKDGVTPGDLAEALGKSTEYLRQLRKTWEQYGPETNRGLGKGASFRDYRKAANSRQPGDKPHKGGRPPKIHNEGDLRTAVEYIRADRPDDALSILLRLLGEGNRNRP